MIRLYYILRKIKKRNESTEAIRNKKDGMGSLGCPSLGDAPHCVLHIAHIVDIMTKALQQQQALFPLLSPICSSWALATI